ncbi:MAG: tRNA uracil 4-sulfurtransferase ThiI [Eubacteriales bacterium]
MGKVILIRYGEIHLKGQNRPYFERLLINEIKRALLNIKCSVIKGEGRFYVENIKEEDILLAVSALKRVFGIHSVSVAVKTDKDMETICTKALEELKEHIGKFGGKSFKVFAKRSDKRYPLKSLDIAREVGGYLLENLKDIHVDVVNPQISVYVEIRESAYIYTNIEKGAEGMPTGSSGRAVLLLSGGLDSPVAGYMVAKRGVNLSAVYFHSFPYTGEQVKQKVLSLAQILSSYLGSIDVHIVSFTKIQTEIHKKCPEDEITLIMRRYMMKIAQSIAKNEGAKALVTGESIGQVASQTMESLSVTDAAVNMCVFRPLIGMDKVEIMDRARQIGTYDTSILPYEDCCTVFVAKHPKTRPHLNDILSSEEALDEQALIEEAISSIETIQVKPV